MPFVDLQIDSRNGFRSERDPLNSLQQRLGQRLGQSCFPQELQKICVTFRRICALCTFINVPLKRSAIRSIQRVIQKVR